MVVSRLLSANDTDHFVGESIRPVLTNPLLQGVVTSLDHRMVDMTFPTDAHAPLKGTATNHGDADVPLARGLADNLVDSVIPVTSLFHGLLSVGVAF